jgi:hypothetical protein
MAMGRAMQAIMAQAAAWMAQYKSELAARSLGFTPDDMAAITASATAHPWPPGGAMPSQADLAEMQHAQQLAMDTVYPETGFASDDPRLVPNGMPRVAYAVAARAIGWANDDTALVDRVVKALGHSHDDYVRAGEHWTALVRTDMAVAMFYGQLFAHVGDLPVRPG